MSSRTGLKMLRWVAVLVLGVLGGAVQAAPRASEFIELSGEVLRDKIRGGLLGQMLGNLNGLKHEFKYIHEPGEVSGYVPALPGGAWTDDDTDFEWVYVMEMQGAGVVFLPSARIAELWKSRINQRIWCSNQFARQLMDLGLTPPLTGNFALNPWADFNISGQFLCETFGLMAPGMPQTAARIGLNYTTVAIDLEPAQTTQLFTAMIATAFLTNDIQEIIEAGLRSIDPKSQLREIIQDVRQWRLQFPDDWRATRRALKDKYSRHNGRTRDSNGYELNTGSTVAALLYGEGDFIKTLTTAFNFGWDCDNTAATAGTIVGVTKGYRWMLSQGWQITDRYKNTTRDQMPMDETISSFADRILELAERVIVDRGGRRVLGERGTAFVIPVERAGNVLALADLPEQGRALRAELAEKIRSELQDGSSAAKARAAYLAICLDLAGELREKSPAAWNESLGCLNQFWKVVQAIYFHAPIPAGDALRKKATAAGLESPPAKRNLW